MVTLDSQVGQVGQIAVGEVGRYIGMWQVDQVYDRIRYQRYVYIHRKSDLFLGDKMYEAKMMSMQIYLKNHNIHRFTEPKHLTVQISHFDYDD